MLDSSSHPGLCSDATFSDRLSPASWVKLVPLPVTLCPSCVNFFPARGFHYLRSPVGLWSMGAQQPTPALGGLSKSHFIVFPQLVGQICEQGCLVPRLACLEGWVQPGLETEVPTRHGSSMEPAGLLTSYRGPMETTKLLMTKPQKAQSVISAHSVGQASPKPRSELSSESVGLIS